MELKYEVNTVPELPYISIFPSSILYFLRRHEITQHLHVLQQMGSSDKKKTTLRLFSRKVVLLYEVISLNPVQMKPEHFLKQYEMAVQNLLRR